jgi:hypothetical protein
LTYQFYICDKNFIWVTTSGDSNLSDKYLGVDKISDVTEPETDTEDKKIDNDILPKTNTGGNKKSHRPTGINENTCEKDKMMNNSLRRDQN